MKFPAFYGNQKRNMLETAHGKNSFSPFIKREILKYEKKEGTCSWLKSFRSISLIALLRAGVTIGTMSLLTVRGRKSGQPRTVPVLLVEQDGQRWLVAPYGVVQWVRNIRAAGTAKLTRGRRSEAISVTELEAREAAPVLKQYLLLVRVVRPYFNVTKDAPLEAFECEAPRHPVFKIEARTS